MSWSWYYNGTTPLAISVVIANNHNWLVYLAHSRTKKTLRYGNPADHTTADGGGMNIKSWKQRHLVNC
jgi:hypothetical protein